MADDPSGRAPAGAGDAGPAELAPESFLRTIIAPSFAEQVRTLRAEITRLEDELREREEAETSIRVRVTGDGGGTWYLNVGGGRMEVGSAPASPVLFSIHQSAEDWRALAARGAMLGGGSAGAPRGRGVFTRSRIARLRPINGTVRVVLKNDAGQERRATLHFGQGEPADPPHTTVVLHEEDARKLREGTLEAQTAFMQGLVTISGDVNIAVQVGTALFL